MSNYLITGASSEIGNALARYLDKCGHHLLLVSRSSKTDDLASKHSWLTGFDLSNESDLNRLTECVKQTFDSPFTLIHSVGDFWAHKSIANTSLDEAKRLVSSHYITLFGTSKAVIPTMKQVGGGKIIAFSCNSVKYNYPDMAGFTSCKAAVECLIKCIANEVSQYGITANAIALPSIKTQSVIDTKPQIFHKDYVTLTELTSSLEATIEHLTPLITGSVISVVKYSDSFYHKGYYERNIIWEDKFETRDSDT